MADKAINELVAATQVTPDSLFVTQQSNTAKKLEAQILENWLVSLADGHGGIQSIIHLSTSGLVDTYRITLADTTTFDFTVTNGKSITGIAKVSTTGLVDTHRINYNDGTHTTFQVTNGRGIENFEKISSVGLVDTYKFSYNDGSQSTFSVANGEKGNPGDTPKVWVRYASQEPTAESHDFGVLPDNWMGFCSNYDLSAPTDWQAYTWFKIKGEKGDIGDPASVQSFAVEYMASDSGTIIPSGSWQQTIPAIAQGRYLWTRITIRFNTGDPIVAYSVSRYGIDGSGSVSMVNQKSPDSNGNVQVTADDVGARPDTWTPTAEDVGALPTSGGTMTGGIDMDGNAITGLPAPIADADAVNKHYAAGLRVRNLLDNSDFTNPVNQRNFTSSSDPWAMTIDRWQKGDTGTARVVHDAPFGTAFAVDGGQIFQRVGTTLKTGVSYTFAVNFYFNNGVIEISNFLTDKGLFQKTVSTDQSGTLLLVSTPEEDIDPSTTNTFFRIVASNTVGFKWAALYEGAYTAETLPPYVPKGYAAELAECKRYFQKFTFVQYETVGCGYEGPEYAFVQLAADVEMRLPNPSVNFSAPIIIGSSEKTPAATSHRNGNIILGVNYSPISAPAGAGYSYCSTAGGVVITLSADL